MAERVCPPWVGYLLASPLRKLFQNPERILGPYLREGMIALDVGSAMGFFSLPLARMVGPSGKVVCVDVQPKMLRSLEKRAARAGLADRMEMRVCDADSLGLDDLCGQVDFALAFAMVHEVPDSADLFRRVYAALKAGAGFLVAEPRGHVQQEAFDATLAVAREQGFSVVENPQVRGSHAVLLEKAGRA